MTTYSWLALTHFFLALGQFNEGNAVRGVCCLIGAFGWAAHDVARLVRRRNRRKSK